VSASARAPLARPRPVGRRPTPEQRHWQALRDAVADAIDLYLILAPAPNMRRVIADIEELLADGDHEGGLLSP
jgi:hypothetical protein